MQEALPAADAAAGTVNLDLSQLRPSDFLRKAKRYEQQLIDKVSKGDGWIDNERCLVCGSGRRRPNWQAHEVMLLECLDCGHRYFEKMPRNLAEVYQGESYLEQSKSGYLSNVDYRLRRFAAERLDILAANKPFAAGQSLLDVGCGTGWFLRAAKERGYDVSGFEFSAALARFTEESVGCRVYDSDLGAIAARFEVVTLFDVIEHVPSPVHTLRTVRGVLKAGGIALVFCPNFTSLAITAAKADSNLVMPTRHLSYFTKSLVQRLCTLAGMRLLWFKTAGIDIGDMMSWCESRGTQRDLHLWQRLSDALQPAIDALEVGNHLRFMAVPAVA